jgi:DNA-binding response OmpR family regulator
VAPGARPPACGALEDWIRLPVDPGELRSRADRLVARAAWQGPSPVVVDGDGVVRVGAQLTIVGPQEAMLLRRLAAPAGRLVARHELVEAVWGEDVPSDPRALDNRVKALRRHLVGLPVRIHTVRGRGFLLEVSAVG